MYFKQLFCQVQSHKEGHQSPGWLLKYFETLYTTFIQIFQAWLEFLIGNRKIQARLYYMERIFLGLLTKNQQQKWAQNSEAYVTKLTRFWKDHSQFHLAPQQLGLLYFSRHLPVHPLGGHTCTPYDICRVKMLLLSKHLKRKWRIELLLLCNEKKSRIGCTSTGIPRFPRFLI